MFTFEAVSKATGTSSKGGAYQVGVRIVYTNNSWQDFAIPFTKATHGWERVAIAFVSSRDFKQVIVSITYANQTGTVWFMDPRLSVGIR